MKQNNTKREDSIINSDVLLSTGYFEPPSHLQYFFGRLIKRVPIISKLFSSLCWSYPDGIRTPHNKLFVTSSKFSKSYYRAIKACGEDYRIPFRVHQVLWAVQSTLHLDGDLVELGTGKGFIMSAALASIENWQALNKTCWLYDVFQQPDVSGLGNLNYAQYYANNYDEVYDNFSEWENINIVQGNIFDSLTQKAPQKIAFLHVDLNNAEAEVYSINLLWPKIIQGGIIILDDYANRGHEEQFHALNNLFDKFNRPILSTPSGQGILIK